MGYGDLLADPRYHDNNARVQQRAVLLPELRQRLKHHSAAELSRRFEQVGLPYAPIVKPEELFDDPHLLATGGLADVVLTDGPRAGETAKAALLPFTMAGERLGVRSDPPRRGQDTDALLLELGLSASDVQHLREAQAVA
jgi:crotonobetainyl-CoA:carnitine CoA-transferase CaiB-like acyl-CoA transferase